VYAFKGTNGAVIWERELPYTTWAQGSPVGLDIDGDGMLEILAGSDSGFYSLNALNGEVEWYFPTGSVRGQPFVVDLEKEGGAEIVYSSSSTVYVIEQRKSPPEPGEDGFRTIGFWKHQCRAALGENNGNQHIDSATLEEYLQLIADSTTVPELGAGGDSIGIEGMCEILDLSGKQPMRNRAIQQLLALWLNFANSAGDWDTMVDSDRDCIPDIALGDAIEFIEETVNDPDATKDELEAAKDMADSINNSGGC
jgi:hypothetical protein